MARTIRARFSHGVIKPLEKVEFSEGEEFTVIIHEAPKKPKKEKFSGCPKSYGWRMERFDRC